MKLYSNGKLGWLKGNGKSVSCTSNQYNSFAKLPSGYYSAYPVSSFCDLSGLNTHKFMIESDGNSIVLRNLLNSSQTLNINNSLMYVLANPKY